MSEHCRFRAPSEGQLLIWELTRLCNLECLHCCTSSGPRASTVFELPTEVALDCARRLGAGGVSRVVFSGGEPLIRPDLAEIVGAVDASRVETYVATNGTLLRPAVIDRLRAAGLSGFDVSLDGPTAESYAILRRRHGAFGLALAGIRACCESGMPVRASCVLTPRTLDCIGAMVGLLRDTGLASVVFHTVRGDAGRAISHPEVVLDEARLTDVWHRVLAAVHRVAPGMDVQLRPTPDGHGVAGCRGGGGILHIAPNGDLSPCAWLYRSNPARFCVGNIAETPLDSLVAAARDPIRRLGQIGSGCPLPMLGKRAETAIDPEPNNRTARVLAPGGELRRRPPSAMVEICR